MKEAKSPFPPIMAYMCAWAGTRPAHAIFRPGQHKIQTFQNIFLDIVTTHNGCPSYVKHVLGSIYVLFALFGY